ncbi:MAG: ABC transporter permease [Lentisphaerae bacterium]|jgi:phospholipid/cholesterol/gamma-HCH transport system permease protein|nr:ABC transporter permease [Lentisphaerota bacterium]
MIIREPVILPERKGFLAKIGQKVVILIGEAGRCAMVGIGAFAQMPHVFNKRSRGEVIRQLYICAVKSLPVVTVVAFFIGMVLALQIGIELRHFNQEHLIGSVVMATMLREMGPFMSGLVIAASVGASMAAQMGTMTVNDEIAALEIMSINPLRFLVMPRMVAMIIAMPLLSFYTCMLGLVGGGVVGYTQFTVPLTVYWTNAMDFANLRSFHVGLFKATIFGIIIVTVSCYEGFTTTRGAVGVGHATRTSVVLNFLLILIVGYFVTRLFY